MTLAELNKRYKSLYISNDAKLKARAAGLLEIINRFNARPTNEPSDVVFISIIAEEYKAEQEKIYNAIKKDEYRQHILAANECIIKYMSSTEITKALVNYNPIDKSLANYINYLKGVGVIDRIKYNDLKSAYDLLML